MATKVKATSVKIWKNCIRMRNSFLFLTANTIKISSHTVYYLRNFIYVSNVMVIYWNWIFHPKSKYFLKSFSISMFWRHGDFFYLFL